MSISYIAFVDKDNLSFGDALNHLEYQDEEDLILNDYYEISNSWSDTLKTEKRTDNLFRKFSDHENKYQNINGKSLLEARICINNCIKLLNEIESVEDIRQQIQICTIIIKKIDEIREIYYIKNDNNRRKICALIRMTLKLNCGEFIFEQVHIDTFVNACNEIINCKSEKNINVILDSKFSKVGLRTIPSWE